MSPATVQSEGHNRWWWLVPLAFVALLIAGMVAVCMFSEIGREVLYKAVMYVLGFLSTPFILETSTLLVGLFVVVFINHLRMSKEGDDWVVMEVPVKKDEDLESSKSHRLEETKPAISADFDSRLAVIEGYLELGMAREALDELQLLSPEEKKEDRVWQLERTARARLNHG